MISDRDIYYAVAVKVGRMLEIKLRNLITEIQAENDFGHYPVAVIHWKMQWQSDMLKWRRIIEAKKCFGENASPEAIKVCRILEESLEAAQNGIVQSICFCADNFLCRSFYYIAPRVASQWTALRLIANSHSENPIETAEVLVDKIKAWCDMAEAGDANFPSKLNDIEIQQKQTP